MAKRDYYDVLGVARAASDQEIKAAFRRLAKECHPDRCNGDQTSETRFKEVNEAYEALKDPQKRAAYDRFGHAAFENGMGGHPHGFGADFSASMSAMFDDLFGEFMGQTAPAPALGAGTRRRPSLQYGDHARGSLRGQDRADPRADLGHLRGLYRLRRQVRHRANDLPHLRRRRQGTRGTRLLHHRAHLSRPARDAAR